MPSDQQDLHRAPYALPKGWTLVFLQWAVLLVSTWFLWWGVRLTAATIDWTSWPPFFETLHLLWIGLAFLAGRRIVVFLFGSDFGVDAFCLFLFLLPFGFGLGILLVPNVQEMRSEAQASLYPFVALQSRETEDFVTLGGPRDDVIIQPLHELEIHAVHRRECTEVSTDRVRLQAANNWVGTRKYLFWQSAQVEGGTTHDCIDGDIGWFLGVLTLSPLFLLEMGSDALLDVIFVFFPMHLLWFLIAYIVNRRIGIEELPRYWLWPDNDLPPGLMSRFADKPLDSAQD